MSNPILKFYDAVQPAFAVLAGCQLDVFTPLSEDSLNVEELAQALNVNADKLRPLLYALVVINLLAVEDERFSLTPDAGTYLVKGQPSYMGSSHSFYSTMFQAELLAAESIRRGTGLAKAEFDYAGMPPDKLERILRGFHAGTMAVGRLLAQTFDFSVYPTLLDVGGGSGGFSIALAQELPDLQATVLDQANVTPVTQRIVDEFGMADRVKVITVDAVRQPIVGAYDVAVMCSFVQALSRNEAGLAIENVGQVIKPGGAIYIFGAVLDDLRLSPPLIAVSNFVFISIYDGGQAYTESEYRNWLSQAGFVDFQRTLVMEGRSVLFARKPAETDLVASH